MIACLYQVLAFNIITVVQVTPSQFLISECIFLFKILASFISLWRVELLGYWRIFSLANKYTVLFHLSWISSPKTAMLLPPLEIAVLNLIVVFDSSYISISNCDLEKRTKSLCMSWSTNLLVFHFDIFSGMVAKLLICCIPRKHEFHWQQERSGNFLQV